MQRFIYLLIVVSNFLEKNAEVAVLIVVVFHIFFPLSLSSKKAVETKILLKGGLNLRTHQFLNFFFMAKIQFQTMTEYLESLKTKKLWKNTFVS